MAPVTGLTPRSAARPATRPPTRRPSRPVAVGGILLAILAAASLALFTRRGLNAGLYGGWVDVSVYRDAAAAWLHGGPLYSLLFTSSALSFTYPPFGLLALLWLGPLSPTGAGRAAVVVNLGALLAVAAVSLDVASPFRRPGRRRPGPAPRVALPAATLVLAALAAWSEPVRLTFGYGQVNLVLMLLVLLDVLLVPPRWRGVLTGLAGAVKLTPMIFLLLFLVTGQRRAAVRSVVAAAAATVLAAVVAPGSSWRFWTSIVWTNTTGKPWFTGNQSLTGAVDRLLRDGPAARPVVLVASVLVIAVGAVAVRRAWRAGWLLTATATCGVVGLLVSPISWSHHWVWTVPLVVGLVLEVRVRGARVLAAVLAVVVAVAAHRFLPQWDDRELSWTWWMNVVGNSYCYVGLAVLAVVAVLASRATPAGPGAEPRRVGGIERTATARVSRHSTTENV